MFCEKIKLVKVDFLREGDYICIIDVPCVISKVRKKPNTVLFNVRDLFEWENYKITLNKNEFVLSPNVMFKDFKMVEISDNQAHLIGSKEEKIQVQINKYELVVLEHAFNDCEKHNSHLIVNVVFAMGRNKIIHFKKEFIFF
jgi:translation elongation factor P/translation initiation factor 5A